MRRFLLGTALAALMVVPLAGCSSEPTYSTNGVVESKESEYECSAVKTLGMAVVVAPQATTTPKPKVTPVPPWPGSTRLSSTTTQKPSEKPKEAKSKKPLKPGTCAWDWEVDVKQSNGSVVEVDVTEDHWGRCDAGENFPECVKG